MFSGSSAAEVRLRLRQMGVDDLSGIEFAETLTRAPEPIAFAHVDVMVEDAVRPCLEKLWPKAAPGGVVSIGWYVPHSERPIEDFLATVAEGEARLETDSAWHRHRFLVKAAPWGRAQLHFEDLLRRCDMMRVLRQKTFRAGVPASIAALALALPGFAAAAAHPAPQQFCQVQFAAGGPLYSGVGISVTTPAGNSTSVCRVRVSPPPETIVMMFPDAHGDTVVITRGGAAIVVFH